MAPGHTPESRAARTRATRSAASGRLPFPLLYTAHSHTRTLPLISPVFCYPPLMLTLRRSVVVVVAVLLVSGLASAQTWTVTSEENPLTDVLTTTARISVPGAGGVFNFILRRANNRQLIYEYACHEGNYAMANILSAQRAADRKAEEAGR